MEAPRRIVYVLKSEPDPARYYTGLTSNLAARVDAHNAGRVPHTASGKPWNIDVVVEFSDERRAVAFEKYVKSRIRLCVSRSATCDDVPPRSPPHDPPADGASGRVLLG